MERNFKHLKLDYLFQFRASASLFFMHSFLYMFSKLTVNEHFPQKVDELFMEMIKQIG